MPTFDFVDGKITKPYMKYIRTTGLDWWWMDYHIGECWFLDGELHREDGPAIIHSDGEIVWYTNGVRHRENLPARVDSGGVSYWYENGVMVYNNLFY